MLAIQKRSIAEPVAPRQAHEEENGTQNDRRRSTQDDGTAARRWQVMAAGRLSPGSSVVAPAAADHCDRPMATANRASSCLHCFGPGDENVGPLALATSDPWRRSTLTTLAWRPSRRWGLRTRSPLSWRATICPWPGTAVVTLRRLVVTPTAPSRRFVTPITGSDIHLVLEPKCTAS